MSNPRDDDALFERLAAESNPSELPPESSPAGLRNKLYASLAARQRDDGAFETLAAVTTREAAMPSLKSRIYSALLARQAESGPLLALPAVKAGGRGLCVFEHLVRITSVGEKLQSFNYCRICHARVLGERMNHAPIYWPQCPYVRFQGR